jgi:iron complex outermembrane receptor protein
MEASDLGGGGIWYWDDAAPDLRVSVNLLGLDGDGGVRVAEDALYAVGRPELSNAPGPSNESHRYRGLFAELTWGELFAAFKLLDDDYGDHFGINHFLPPDDDRLASRQGYQSLQLGANRRLSEDLRARLRLEALQYQRARDRLYVFPGGLLTANPVFMDQDYRETRYLGAADINWLPHPRHALLLGLEASQVAVDEATWEWPAELEIDDPWLDDGRNRRILSLVAQDQFSASDRMTLTGTLRHDDYSDSGSHTSPRLAAVWRLDEQRGNFSKSSGKETSKLRE